jgi:excisionase family DNA binding protein
MEMPNATARPKNPLHSEKEQPVPISATDRTQTEQLYAAFRRGKAKMVGPSGEARLLPNTLHSFLVALIGFLNEGKSVMIVQNQAKLTTIEAASLLGVSRQFLVNLLEKEEIPYHLVGTHRRIYAEDLFQYKLQRDGHRHKVIRELAQVEAEEGLYGREPSVDED